MKHGYSKHPLYSKLNQMKQRCYNKNHPLYHCYGAKGITVCQEWLNDVGAFIKWAEANGYDEINCSINRIDPRKGYTPDNCNFMTPAQNSAYHPIALPRTPRPADASFIRAMYFRDDAEEQAVKDFIAQLRGKRAISTPQVNPQPAPQAPRATFASYPVELPKLPDFLTDIMNGGAFPAPEELTRAEQAILYDTQVNTLVNLYRQSKNNDLAQHIRERLDELGVDF